MQPKTTVTANRSNSTQNQQKSKFTRIMFAGNNDLYNQLLTTFISEKLYIPCTITTPDKLDPLDTNLLLINLQECTEPPLSELLDQLQASSPERPVALITNGNNDHSDQFLSWPIIKGIFHCQEREQLLIKGILAIAAGEYWFSRHEMNLLAEHRPPPQPSKLVHHFALTNREREILAHLSQGMTNQEMAQALFLSPHTIKSHLYNLYKKLGVKNRTQAVKLAQELSGSASTEQDSSTSNLHLTE